MTRALIGLAGAALLLGACGNGRDAEAPVEGPVVSESETPRNPAVDTTQNAADGTLTPGANSFTEGQARSAIEKQGYAQIGALSQGQDGVWTATAVKDGVQSKVSVDYKGVVSASPAS
ncbi:hypothetical protein ACLBV5_14155 [Brevundimonas sp. M1A4_2e]|uniref:PepSY domain-containing protein n=1 Tax=Brevundimonas naejangsanensis TaxID=588932 RepID=A0A172Y3L8_9CAUL|nr:hypothetical protein [Brevundimonas naejangsanensis]ANF53803.1 hypothetical protein DA69_02970 [Brevundimonas naejangsanensis]